MLVCVDLFGGLIWLGVAGVLLVLAGMFLRAGFLDTISICLNSYYRSWSFVPRLHIFIEQQRVWYIVVLSRIITVLLFGGMLACWS